MTAYYNTPTVVIGIVPFLVRPGRSGRVMEAKLLMVRRALSDGKGKWALPGGYQMLGETVEEALEREILEETGVAVNTSTATIFSLVTTPDRSVNLAFYTVHAKNDTVEQTEFVHDAEVSEVAYRDTTDDMAFPLHAEMAQYVFDWYLD